MTEPGNDELGDPSTPVTPSRLADGQHWRGTTGHLLKQFPQDAHDGKRDLEYEPRSRREEPAGLSAGGFFIGLICGVIISVFGWRGVFNSAKLPGIANFYVLLLISKFWIAIGLLFWTDIKASHGSNMVRFIRVAAIALLVSIPIGAFVMFFTCANRIGRSLGH